MKFIPRLNTEGMTNSKYWYSNENPYYKSRTYALPNCTCYAYGRVWEITGSVPTYFGSGNAVTYLDKAIKAGKKTGTTPKLGAVMVFGTRIGENPGHVSVVEKIAENGDVTCSNSNFRGEYFFLTTHTKSSGYNNYGNKQYFKGFVYTMEEDFADEPRESGSTTTYKVVKGDTLTKIANKYNTTVNSIYEINKPKYPSMTKNFIVSGWELDIPVQNSQGGSITYIVQRGDSLSKIASKYKSTWQRLYEDNKKIIGKNPNIIKAGQKLIINL